MSQRTTEKLPEPNENPVPHHETPTLGNPDLPQEGMQTTAGDPAGARMTGPQNRVMESQFPRPYLMGIALPQMDKRHCQEEQRHGSHETGGRAPVAIVGLTVPRSDTV